MSSTVNHREASDNSAPEVGRILLIESDEEIAKLVANAIRGARELTLERAATLAAGLERLSASAVRLVVVGAELPDGRGAPTVRSLRKMLPEVPILVLGDISEPEAVRLATAGAQACLQRKALTQTTLQRAMSRALANPARAPAPPSGPAAKPISRLAVSLTIGTLRVANDGTVRGANPAITRMLGYRVTNELLGQPLSQLLAHDMDWPAIRDGAAAVEPVSLVLRDRNGAARHLEGEVHRRLDAQGHVQGVDLLLVDFTTQRELERALEGASHAEALAALTAGLAHDFNNLLTVIVGNLYLLAEAVRDDETLLGKVKTARDAARRGADLTRQLLTFARQQRTEPEIASVQKVIDDIKLLLARALGSRIQLSTDVASDTWPIAVEVPQLESAIINLAVNARDALEDGGKVAITAANTSVDAAAAERLDIAAGEYVSIDVADNGAGIPEAIRDRIFDAFFTTKGQRGTGLGLGMVRRMVSAAGGAITVESETGRGTTFTLLLPRARGEARVNEMTQPLSTLPTGTESVVVCCRDPQVAQTVHELLDVLGYRVSVAATHEAATAKLAEGPNLLICDASRSQRAEVEALIGNATKTMSALKILLVTDDTWSAELPEEGVHGCLRKPFSLADLAKAVRAALNS